MDGSKKRRPGERSLRNFFFKFEDARQKYRVVYNETDFLPMLDLDTPSGHCPFVTSLKEYNERREKPLAEKTNVTRHGSKKKPSVVRRTYCEICNANFVSSSKHLESARHRQFVEDDLNYREIDEQISGMRTLDDFEIWSKEEAKRQQEDHLLSDSVSDLPVNETAAAAESIEDEDLWAMSQFEEQPMSVHGPIKWPRLAAVEGGYGCSSPGPSSESPYVTEGASYIDHQTVAYEVECGESFAENISIEPLRKRHHSEERQSTRESSAVDEDLDVLTNEDSIHNYADKKTEHQIHNIFKHFEEPKPASEALTVDPGGCDGRDVPTGQLSPFSEVCRLPDADSKPTVDDSRYSLHPELECQHDNVTPLKLTEFVDLVTPTSRDKAPVAQKAVGTPVHELYRKRRRSNSCGSPDVTKPHSQRRKLEIFCSAPPSDVSPDITVSRKMRALPAPLAPRCPDSISPELGGKLLDTRNHDLDNAERTEYYLGNPDARTRNEGMNYEEKSPTVQELISKLISKRAAHNVYQKVCTPEKSVPFSQIKSPKTPSNVATPQSRQVVPSTPGSSRLNTTSLFGTTLFGRTTRNGCESPIIPERHVKKNRIVTNIFKKLTKTVIKQDVQDFSQILFSQRILAPPKALTPVLMSTTERKLAAPRTKKKTPGPNVAKTPSNKASSKKQKSAKKNLFGADNDISEAISVPVNSQWRPDNGDWEGRIGHVIWPDALAVRWQCKFSRETDTTVDIQYSGKWRDIINPKKTGKGTPVSFSSVHKESLCNWDIIFDERNPPLTPTKFIPDIAVSLERSADKVRQVVSNLASQASSSKSDFSLPPALSPAVQPSSVLKIRSFTPKSARLQPSLNSEVSGASSRTVGSPSPELVVLSSDAESREVRLTPPTGQVGHRTDKAIPALPPALSASSHISCLAVQPPSDGQWNGRKGHVLWPPSAGHPWADKRWECTFVGERGDCVDVIYSGKCISPQDRTDQCSETQSAIRYTCLKRDLLSNWDIEYI